jgi:hypothetical protein
MEAWREGKTRKSEKAKNGKGAKKEETEAEQKHKQKNEEEDKTRRGIHTIYLKPLRAFQHDERPLVPHARTLPASHDDVVHAIVASHLPQLTQKQKKKKQEQNRTMDSSQPYPTRPCN